MQVVVAAERNISVIGNLKKFKSDFLVWLCGLQTRLVFMRMWVQSLASIRRLRIQCCRELWCKSQTWLRSRVAVTVV